MPISTKCIIHYTDSFNNLESILKEGFAIKYCAEKLFIAGGTRSAAHPMISFCDIPLSQSAKHFKTYGKYGIGLTKKWAYKMGINPVLYIHKNSLIGKIFGKLLTHKRDTNSDLTKNQKENILRLKSFAKNYSGHFQHKKIDKNPYRFYDEREWRLVPENKDIENAYFSVKLSDFEKDERKYNDKISSCRFKFEPKDISYIIVDKTIEIPKMIGILRAIYKTKYNEELDILFSKMCSTEQILSDY